MLRSAQHNGRDDFAKALAAPGRAAAYSRHRLRRLEGIRMWNAAFSDTHFGIELPIAEGDKVATRVIMCAIHSGDFQGLSDLQPLM